MIKQPRVAPIPTLCAKYHQCGGVEDAEWKRVKHGNTQCGSIQDMKKMTAVFRIASSFGSCWLSWTQGNVTHSAARVLVALMGDVRYFWRSSG